MPLDKVYTVISVFSHSTREIWLKQACSEASKWATAQEPGTPVAPEALGSLRASCLFDTLQIRIITVQYQLGPPLCNPVALWSCYLEGPVLKYSWNINVLVHIVLTWWIFLNSCFMKIWGYLWLELCCALYLMGSGRQQGSSS